MSHTEERAYASVEPCRERPLQHNEAQSIVQLLAEARWYRESLNPFRPCLRCRE
jgi:hypothetical protein